MPNINTLPFAPIFQPKQRRGAFSFGPQQQGDPMARIAQLKSFGGGMPNFAMPSGGGGDRMPGPANWMGPR